MDYQKIQSAFRAINSSAQAHKLLAK